MQRGSAEVELILPVKETGSVTGISFALYSRMIHRFVFYFVFLIIFGFPPKMSGELMAQPMPTIQLLTDSIRAWNRTQPAKARKWVDSLTVQVPSQYQFWLLKHQVYSTQSQSLLKTDPASSFQIRQEACDALLRGARLAGKEIQLKDSLSRQLLACKTDLLQASERLFREQQLSQAVQSLQQAESYHNAYRQWSGIISADSALWLLKAKIYMQQGVLREAEMLFSRLEKGNYPSAEVYYHLGHLYKMKGDTAACLNTFQKGVKRYPKDKDLLIDWFTYGVLYDRETWVMSSLEDMLRQNEDKALLYYMLATVYEHVGQIRKAELYYLNAAKENKRNDPQISYNIAIFYYNQAVELNKILINQNPEDTQNQSFKGERDRLLKSSIPFFESAMAVDSLQIQRILRQIKGQLVATP